MSLKSKKNKLLRNISRKLSRLDSDSVGNNELEDMCLFLRNKQPVIFDVGANEGQSVFKFSQKFPQSKIYSFEPSKNAFSILKDKTSHLKNVSLMNFALGAHNHKMAFNEHKSSVMSSFLEADKIVDNDILEVYSVEIMTMDNFYEDLFKRDSHIDILKIDTQGYDLEVLKGAEMLLKSNKIGLIYLELNFGKMYKNQSSFPEIFQYLIDNRFSLVSFYEFHYHNNLASWTDGLFVHESLVK